jgi:hypothetical protein
MRQPTEITGPDVAARQATPRWKGFRSWAGHDGERRVGAPGAGCGTGRRLGSQAPAHAWNRPVPTDLPTL